MSQAPEPKASASFEDLARIEAILLSGQAAVEVDDDQGCRTAHYRSQEDLLILRKVLRVELGLDAAPVPKRAPMAGWIVLACVFGLGALAGVIAS